MPSSAHPIARLITAETPEDHEHQVKYLLQCLSRAQELGLTIEWLESFVGAHNAGANIYEAAFAGLEEWDT